MKKYISKLIKINISCWFVGSARQMETEHFTLAKVNKINEGFILKYHQAKPGTYNLRVLYYVKKMLGVGQVSISGNMAEYRIRDLKSILQHIIPIFDKYPLLTSKYFNYDLFKQAALIFSNPVLSKEKKDELLTELKSKIRPDEYISPAWSIINNLVTSKTEAMIVMSKLWIIGFTEAEGSFYIVTKEKGRMTHGFEITQKLDKIVLTSIGFILGMIVVKKKLIFQLFLLILKL